MIVKGLKCALLVIVCVLFVAPYVKYQSSVGNLKRMGAELKGYGYERFPKGLIYSYGAIEINGCDLITNKENIFNELLVVKPESISIYRCGITHLDQISRLVSENDNIRYLDLRWNGLDTVESRNKLKILFLEAGYEIESIKVLSGPVVIIEQENMDSQRKG